MDIGDKPVGTAKTTVTSVVKPLDLLLIRDDCYLCRGNTDILAFNQRLRIYHGKVTDSWEVRKKFLDGQEAYKWGAAVITDPGKVDITRLSREELIVFAEEEYGLLLDSETEYAHALVAIIQRRTDTEKAEAAKSPPPPGNGRTQGVGTGIAM
jgi:hypothetical protein